MRRVVKEQDRSRLCVPESVLTTTTFVGTIDSDRVISYTTFGLYAQRMQASEMD